MGCISIYSIVAFRICGGRKVVELQVFVRSRDMPKTSLLKKKPVASKWFGPQTDMTTMVFSVSLYDPHKGLI
jgi:hypothetical protein